MTLEECWGTLQPHVPLSTQGHRPWLFRGAPGALKLGTD